MIGMQDSIGHKEKRYSRLRLHRFQSNEEAMVVVTEAAGKDVVITGQ